LRCGASIFAKTLEISFAKLWIRLIDLKSDIDRDSLSLVAIQCMPSSGSADFVDCLLEKKATALSKSSLMISQQLEKNRPMKPSGPRAFSLGDAWIVA
jgi:hypothetical protein